MVTGTRVGRRGVAVPPPSGRDILLLAQIVDLVRTGVANTRPELEQATGLGRTVVNERLREGMDLGVVEEGGTAQAERGRPSFSPLKRRYSHIAAAAIVSRSQT